jgi:hypothetical protein
MRYWPHDTTALVSQDESETRYNFENPYHSAEARVVMWKFAEKRLARLEHDPTLRWFFGFRVYFFHRHGFRQQRDVF